ncbi:MAG: hypothetical protein LM590_16520 [Thermofilum sp.]|nr:hypothetical protein [Thermofilum sp.]
MLVKRIGEWAAARRARGTKIHCIASMRYNIDAAIRHLKLGNYISLAVHSHLGTPYVISVNKYLMNP